MALIATSLGIRLSTVSHNEMSGGHLYAIQNSHIPNWKSDKIYLATDPAHGSIPIDNKLLLQRDMDPKNVRHELKALISCSQWLSRK